MRITELNKDNINEIEFKNVGCRKLRIAANEMVNVFTEIEDGVVKYNKAEIDIFAMHMFLRLSTNLFDGVKIEDEDVNDILLSCAFYPSPSFKNESVLSEYDYFTDCIFEGIEFLKRENSLDALSKELILSLRKNIGDIAETLNEKIATFNAKETVDVLTEVFKNLTAYVKKEDVDKIKEVVKRQKKNGIN